MKKTNKIIMMLIIALMISILPVVSNADTTATKDNATESTKDPTTETTTPLTLEGVYITSKAGEYKIGDVITFEVRFSDKIQEYTKPSLEIKIGERKKTIYTSEQIKYLDKAIQYSYTITREDMGKVTFSKFYNGNEEILLKNSKGESIYVKNTAKNFANSVDINIEPSWTKIEKIETKLDEVSYSLTLSELQENQFHDYYMFFTYDNEEVKIEKGTDGKISNAYSKYSKQKTIKDVLEKKGDIYMSIVEEQRDYSKENDEYIYKIISNKTKIERPAEKTITQRIYGIFYDLKDGSDNLVFCTEAHSEKRKLNIHIGKITDISILKSIKNKEHDGMSKLLKYAKNNSNSDKAIVLEEQNSIGLFKASQISTALKYEPGEYYYMYFSLDNENEEYVDVEDIGLFGCFNSDSAYWLATESDSTFKWTISDENPVTDTTKPAEDNKNTDNKQEQPKDDTVSKEDKLPFTGVGIGLIMSIVVVTIAGIIMYKKVKYYKGI